MIIRRASEADFTFTVDGYTEELRVLRFNGNEGISEPPRYTLKLAALDSAIDFNTIVGKSACLTIANEIADRHVNGIITRLIQSGIGNEYTFYHVELVPLVWLLKYRRGCRIFQNMTFEAIITQIFEDARIGNDYYRFALTGTHNSHEYCVQYRESEFDFISRLMEEEGMFYYFEHDEDMHVMVIADNSSVHTQIESSTVVFNEPSSMVAETEAVYEFRFLQQIRPSSTILTDFNYERPNLGMGTMSLSANEDMLPEEENLEVYDYPGDYQDPEFGVEIAGLRLEALKYNREMGIGKSVCRRFLPGYRFTLDGHSRSSFNQEYLITRLNNFGVQPLGEGNEGEGLQYNNDFECIAYSVPFRPSRKTPKPIVDGVQTAYVVGPGSDDIHFDEMGRVKVQFHWDREGRRDENSSCWVRVSDGYAGQDHGIQFPPLVDDEVLVSFEEGDPDRPIITGRLYNGENMPPLDPNDSIQNAILTPYGHKFYFDDKRQAIVMKTGKDSQFRMRDEPSDSSDREKGHGNYIILNTCDEHRIQMAYGDDFKHIFIKSSSNHFIELDDKAGSISITSAGGHKVVLDDANQMIQLVSKDGHSITINDAMSSIGLTTASLNQGIIINDDGTIDISNTNSNIELYSSSTVKIDASNIDITSSGDINMKATGKIKMEAANIEAKATNIKLSSVNTEIKSTGTKISGTKIGITGVATDIKGTPIKLN